MHHPLRAAEMSDVAVQDPRKVVNMIALCHHPSIRLRRLKFSVIKKVAGCQNAYKSLIITTLCLTNTSKKAAECVTESEITPMEGNPITTLNEIMLTGNEIRSTSKRRERRSLTSSGTHALGNDFQKLSEKGDNGSERKT